MKIKLIQTLFPRDPAENLPKENLAFLWRQKISKTKQRSTF
jgi:hypothetical protein